MMAPNHPRISRPDCKILVALTLIFLLAAAVRILNIDGPALWTDEGFTYYTFKIDLFEAIQGDRHPPFYFYTLHAWVKVAGDSVLAMRWWSLLPSLLAIGVGYQLGREILRYRSNVAGRSGLLGIPVLAALMLALADPENYMAQELRMYTWHTFSCSLSTLMYLRYIRKANQRHAVGWIAANTLLIYTHYFGVFVLLVQGVHALLFLRNRTRVNAVIVLAVTGLLFLPWFLAVTLDQFAEEAVCVNCAPPDNWANLLDFRDKWFGQQWPLMGLLLIFGIAGPGARHAMPLRKNILGLNPLSIPFLLLGLIIVPIVGTYFFGHDEVIFFARRLVQITVPISLLIALGIGNFPVLARGVIVAAILLYGVTTVDWYRAKVPWHTMTEIVAEYAEAGELALVEVDFEESALLYYYDHLLPEGMQIDTFPVWSGDDPSAYYELYLPELLADQREIQTDSVKTAWVVYFSPTDRTLQKLQSGGYQRTMTVAYNHLNSTVHAFRYDLLPDTSVAAFEPEMILRAVEINPESLRVELWWEGAVYLDADYTVSAFLTDANGALVAQLDSPPFNGQRPTSTWQPGDVVYDPHDLVLVDGLSELPPGEYTVNVKVYRWSPEGIIDIPTVDGEDWAVVGTLVWE